MDSELKEMLRERAEDVRVKTDLPRPVLRRARRRRALNAAVAGLAAGVVVAGAVVGVQAALHNRAAPIAPSPTPSATATGGSFGTDPEDVARAFADQQMSWGTAGVSLERTDVSSTEVRIDLWNLAVTKRAGVGPRAPAFATTLTLQGGGSTGPDGVWEVTDVRTGLIDLQCPSSRQDVLAVSKPQDLCGTLAWTPAEGIVDAALYVGALPTRDKPSPPSAICQAPISFPDFNGRFGFVPGGADSAFLAVRLVDPEGVTMGMMARKMVLESAVAPASPATVAQLPQAVAKTRDLIVRAAVGPDYGSLAALIDERTFVYSLAESGDPVGYWKQLERRGEVPILGDFLRILLLDTHPAKSGDTYVWPGSSAKDPNQWTEQDLRDLRHLYDDATIRGFKKLGGYGGYRVGIREDGTWMFFVGGD
jgi:hypothetical protein